MPLKAGTSNHALTLDRIYGMPDLDGNDISLIAWSPDGKLLTWLVGHGGSVHLMAFDVTTSEKRMLLNWDSVPGSITTGPRTFPWDASGDTLPWRIRNVQALHGLSIYYAWSPNGTQMLLGNSLMGPYYLFDVANRSIGPALPIDPAASDIDFSPDGRWLSYVLNYNLYLLDTINGQTVTLTHGGTEHYRYATCDTLGDFLTEGYWWSPDSTRLATLVTYEREVPVFARQRLTSPEGAFDAERFPRPGENTPAMAICVHTAQGETMIADSGPDYYLARVQWLDDSRRLALQLLNREQNHLVLALADATTGVVTPILEERSSTWINLSYDLTFLSGGNAFIWSSERQSYRHLFLYSIDGKQLAQLTSGDAASVDIKAFDEKNSTIYFRTYFSPYLDSQLARVKYHMHGQHVTVDPVEILTHGPGTHATVISPDCAHFAEQFSDVTTPPALHLCLADGKMVKILENNRVEPLSYLLQPVEFPAPLRAAKIGHPSDEMPLCHRIIRPPDMKKGQKYPVIVYMYGGPVPGGSSRTVVNKWVHVPDLWCQMMASRGYIVYSLDNRGSCEAPRGHLFESAIRYQLGCVELADQMEGVRYLKSLPYVDPERIGVFGGSFGGFMALNCMLRAPAEFKAGVAFAPVTDWKDYDAIYTEQYMGLPDTNVAGYELTRLPPSAGKLRGRMLLVHGTADQNVHLHHSFRLIDELVKADKNIELMMYPGMEHADFFEVTPRAKQLFERITKFFVEHL